MMKNLVIVESPAKAKTIERFLGKEFQVKSSFGHVRDLSKSQLGIDIENNFKPRYEIPADKKKVVAELKKYAKAAETVWLATDEDREGEAISWHLAETLGLDENSTKRIVFHEITKNAILKAVENPRAINKQLVDAQQARRVLDRIVGYEISPILWKKVKPALSAGRVQSVAVRLIVERENEIKSFKSAAYYKITAQFEVSDDDGTYQFSAELPERLKTLESAQDFLEKCIPADFSVDRIETKPAKKSPAPPFTTSTLQQEASRKLGFSVSKTMLVAQQLYEAGMITYMRTDSVNLSDAAIAAAKTEIENLFGKDYVKIRKYATKSKGAQEAHEAIRPTYLNSKEINGDASQKRLYELIWKRTIASQMSDAILARTNVDIDISTRPENLVAKGEVIKFDGFLKVYIESTDDENGEGKSNILPPLKKGDPLDLLQMLATQKFTQHPPRYTEASLVKKLEELGIGRPSTYAPTISTIQKREYVVKEDRPGFKREFTTLLLKNGKVKESVKAENVGFEKNKLFPTDIGTLVNQFLVQNFLNILDYNFTASVEKEFDEIAMGKMVWNEMIKNFYDPFHKQVEEVLTTSEKMKGEKLLGKDPKTGENVYVKLGRFGAMIQIGETDSDEKPRFAGLRKGQSMEKITLEEAMELFKFPRVVGSYEDKELNIGIGRFGPFVRHDSKFYSLKKTDDPATIDAARAIEIIEEKRKQEKEKLIKEFSEREDVKVLNGRYGPYVSIGKNNFRIPKNLEPASLSLEQCLELAEKQGSKKATKPKPRAKKKS
ncbi:MAG TPA: type I DNA topoisomerase [Bacteroidales bacterium]|nr:type I DNA topoisomerase [Bacteroidales bacterium]